MRQKVADYVLRDYAWRLQTLNTQLQPDFLLKVKDIHGFRAPARPNLYSRNSTKAGDIRQIELWSLDSIDHHFMNGQWYGETNHIPYFPFATNPPAIVSLTSPNSVARLDIAWTALTDPLATGVNVYVSHTSATAGFVLAGFTAIGTTSVSYTTVGGVAINIGTTYWVYITALNQAGYESLPSTTLKCIAGTFVSAGSDCDNSGLNNGYVETDLGITFLSKTGPDVSGLYTYAFSMAWTSPTCGHTQHKTRLNPYAIPTDQTNPDAWLWAHNAPHNTGWDWWAQQRIPAGKTWDYTTSGALTWQVVLKTNVNFTGGQVLYFRIWNSQRTNAWIPIASNVASYTF
jgi:hypothetical protein